MRAGQLGRVGNERVSDGVESMNRRMGSPACDAMRAGWGCADCEGSVVYLNGREVIVMHGRMGDA